MYEEIIKQLRESGDYRVIERFRPVESYHEKDGAETKIAVYIDVETTGLNAQKDAIIELAMVPFEFDNEGRIYRVLPAYNGFQDPGFPIPAEISRITGITDEMVAGQSLDREQITSKLDDAVLIIAHNAGFDRPFMENLDEQFESLWWACSMKDIDWQAQGIESSKLEYLAYKFNYFYEGHRATIDCQAGIHLLSQTLPVSNITAMQELLTTARRTDYRLWAVGAPFETKDTLRERGYRWSTGEGDSYKSWYVDVAEAELENEIDYLHKEIFGREVKELPRVRITAQSRYSRRCQ